MALFKLRMSATMLRAPVASSSEASLPGAGLPPTTAAVHTGRRRRHAARILIEFLLDVFDAARQQIVGDLALGGG